MSTVKPKKHDGNGADASDLHGTSSNNSRRARTKLDVGC